MGSRATSAGSGDLLVHRARRAPFPERARGQCGHGPAGPDGGRGGRHVFASPRGFAVLRRCGKGSMPSAKHGGRIGVVSRSSPRSPSSCALRESWQFGTAGVDASSGRLRELDDGSGHGGLASQRTVHRVDERLALVHRPARFDPRVVPALASAYKRKNTTTTWRPRAGARALGAANMTQRECTACGAVRYRTVVEERPRRMRKDT